jgi:hypothetical protein
MDLSCRISNNLYRYSAFKEEEDTPLLLKPGLLLVISFLRVQQGKWGWKRRVGNFTVEETDKQASAWGSKST